VSKEGGILSINHVQLTKNLVLAKAFKSEAIAILLTIFLGPLGLLYGSFLGSVVILGLMIIGTIISVFYHYFMILIYILWLLCPFLSIFSINRYHRRLLASAGYNMR